MLNYNQVYKLLNLSKRDEQNESMKKKQIKYKTTKLHIETKYDHNLIVTKTILFLVQDSTFVILPFRFNILLFLFGMEKKMFISNTNWITLLEIDLQDNIL